MSPRSNDSPHGRRAQPPWQPPIEPSDNTTTPPSNPQRPWFLPRTWDGRAVAVYVWGRSRPLVHRVVFSMVRTLEPTPFWLEMLQPGEIPEPVRNGWVPPERLYTSEKVEDLEPARAVGNLALWNIVRSDEPATLLAHLTDFVRLPPLIQEVLATTSLGPRLRAVAVGNVDRVKELFQETPGELRWLVNYLRESSVCLVVGSCHPPGVDPRTFDYVFQVTGNSLEDWRNASVVSDRGELGETSHFSQPVPLTEISDVAKLCQSPPEDSVHGRTWSERRRSDGVS